MNSTLINISPQFPSFFIEEQIASDNTLAFRYLIISFELILLSALNQAKLKEIPLLTVSIQNFSSKLNLTLFNDFDFTKMKYEAVINFNHTKDYVYSANVVVDKYNMQDTRSQRVTVMYLLQNNQLFQKNQNSKIQFFFGALNADQKYSFKGKYSILNFQYDLQGSKKTANHLRKQQTALTQLPDDPQKSRICNIHDDTGSFPIVYLDQLKNAISEGQQYFEQQLKYLEPYSAINTTSKQYQMFVCHDMKNGYAEDTIFTNPISTHQTNSYRFHYFWQSSVFNYFSHKTISIPPKHWRVLCQRYQVKCLGTFIVEPQKINQKFYLKDEFALKLIYVAKKYKFDGYLINIENAVQDYVRLKAWLKFLVEKIHEEIPGSMISWYDSVTSSGSLQYQNEINDKNKIFYDLTDTFYTNYWWNDEKLKDDLKLAKPNKTIFVGNDVWGRGTYGGGQYSLFSAIDQIDKFNKPNKPNLAAALFAPGYTYQTGGQNNNPIFKANEDRLYRGVTFDQYNISWSAANDQQIQSLNLPASKQWQTKSYKMNLWLYKNKGKLKITMMFKTNQSLSAPQSFLSYKIVMKIHETLVDEILEISQTFRESIEMTERSVRKVEIMINTDRITPKTDIQIVKATSRQSSFDGEKILISYYQAEKDWIQNKPLAKLDFNQPYNSFFNVGYGDKFHFQGQVFQASYNYLSDFDMPHTSSINHPFSTQVQHSESFIGGSSLLLLNPSIKLLLFDIPKTVFNYPHEYKMKIVTKGGIVENLYLSQQNGASVFFAKIQEQQYKNGWKQTIYHLSNELIKTMKKKFFKELETSLSITLKQKCLLGQIYLKPIFLNNVQTQKSKFDVIISQSHPVHNPNQVSINIDVIQKNLDSSFIDSSKTSRFLLTIDDKFSAFVYLDKSGSQMMGKLEQIPLRLSNNHAELKILDVDSEIQQQIILVANRIDLKQLKEASLGHKIRLRNY